jgi:hypothetical protein
VDDTGKIVREVKMASEPEALLVVLSNPAYHFKRIGLEAGPLAQWLFSALAEAALPVICVEIALAKNSCPARLSRRHVARFGKIEQALERIFKPCGGRASNSTRWTWFS